MIPFKKVLIIDDSPIDSFLNEKALAKFHEDIETKTFNFPLEAITYLNSINDLSIKNQIAFIPDIVFLDLNMPLLNGFQFLDDLENSQAFVEHPIDIYLLSSSCDHDDIQMALNKRFCLGYINKPLNQKKIINLLGHINAGQKEKMKSVFWWS